MTTKRPMPEDYHPYHNFAAFHQGITDYMEGRFRNPYSGNPRQGLAAEAWIVVVSMQCGCSATPTATEEEPDK
jgi:hypothetical protein